MFYSSSDIDEKLKCSFCNEAFFDVVKLIPECSESICDLCYRDLRENVKEAEQYNCKVCNEWHEMSMKGFSDNKGFMRMLQTRKIEKPLSEQAKTLKRFIETVPSQLRALEKFDERDHINHHCDQLEVEVIEEIDSLVKHLNEIGDGLLKQIREYRERCLESLSTRSSSQKEPQDDESSKTKVELSALARALQDFGAKWSDYFSRVDAFVTDGDIEAALNTTKHFETRMRSLGVKLTNSALDGRIMKFQITHTFLGEFSPLRNLLVLSIEKTDQRIHKNTLVTFTGHSDQVFQAIFLEDDRIASCSKDTTIKIWSVESRSQLFELKGHSDWVISLVLLQNGWLASGSRDKTIILLDLEKRRPIKTLHGHMNPVVSLKKLKNGNLVSYSLDDTVRIWNPFLNENNLILTITGHGNKKWIIPFDILSNNNVVTCSRDNHLKDECILRVWNSNDGALITTTSTGCVAKSSVLVLSNDQVALGFENGTIKIIDLSDHSKTRTREKAYNGPVTSFELMPNGNLLSGGEDSNANTIKVWNVIDLVLLYSIPTEHSGLINSMRLSPNGEFLISSSSDKIFKLWSTSSK